MSRIGKRPIPIPNKVTEDINGDHIVVKGPKGTLESTLPSHVSISQEGDNLQVQRQDDSRIARERHGLSRTLVFNMVEGVSNGFETRLEIQGVGYRAQAQGNKLTLNLGYSKPVEMSMPQGIDIKVENNTLVIVSCIDKEIVGNIAAKIREVRSPEPYKGKGVRYLGEFVRRKAGKSKKK